MTGRFIVLEGLDGAGISTQCGRLTDWIETERGLAVTSTAEPSDGEIGRLIRATLEHQTRFGPAVLALLFAGDRLDHLAATIEPRLTLGDVVVCGRYYLSSLAYQSSDGLDADWLLALNARARRPDLTVFLDVPVAISLERIARRGLGLQLFEREAILTRVRANFVTFIDRLRSRGERIEVVDGARAIEEVRRDVIAHAATVLDGRIY